MPDRSASSLDSNLTLIAFDFGHRRIGTAVGQTVTGTASALEVLARDGVLWQRIEQLLDQWHPHALVVGLPLAEDGSEQTMSRACREFAAQLEQRFGLAVHLADERFSSRAAQDRFREQRRSGGARRSGARREDAVAAQIILEQWLNDHPAGR